MILSNYLYSYSPGLWLEIFRFGCVVTAQPTGSPGDNSKWVPPDSISNSEVKPLSADDSVGSPHVKVGHRRGINTIEAAPCFGSGFFRLEIYKVFEVTWSHQVTPVLQC